MIRVLTGISFLVIGVTSCASKYTRNNKDTLKLPDSEYKSLAVQLTRRNPEQDARMFFSEGGIGFVMGYGGVITPLRRGRWYGIQSEPWISDARFRRPFSKLQATSPHLFFQINPLLEDPVGPLTMMHFTGATPIAVERKIYTRERSEYGTVFNEEMARLVKSEGEQADGGNQIQR